MSSSDFSIEQPEVIREKFYPPYLQKDIANFKEKHAILKIKENSVDDMARKIYQEAADRELELIHEVIKIHRVKRGGKERLVYTDNIHLNDKNGNEIRQFLHTYGTSRHPVIKESKDGKLVPGGIKVEHDIPFNIDEFNKVVELCHEDYRDQITFAYSEIPIDSKEPYNLQTKYAIKNKDIFITATNKEIKKMIQLKKQDIENLSELQAPPLVIQTSAKSTKT
ncbi:MAG: hypothetical protein R2685_10850 [Candidatus Nitrosocosmicus sp.]|nr:hypothetical protein [Candidatus Nitrosocosmicus sp.]